MNTAQKRGLTVFILLLASVLSASATTNTIFTDLEGDGDLDMFLEILLETQAGPSFVRLNGTDGIGNIPNITQGYFVNVDGDGDEDLYIVREGLANYLYRNNGDKTFTNISGTTAVGRNLTSDPTAAPGTAFADWDGDGDIDAFVEGQFFVTVGSFADTNGTNASNLDELPRITHAIANDINLDGEPDFIGAAQGGSIVVFINLGDNNADSIPEFYDATRIMQLEDITSTNFVASDDLDVGLLVNRSLGFFPFIGLPPPFILDEFQDLYLARNGSNQLLIQRMPRPSTPLPANVASTFYLPRYTDRSAGSGIDDAADSTGAIIADFDGVGELDIFIANADPTSQLYLRNGSSWDTTFINASLNLTNLTNIKIVQAADIEPDGDLELAGINDSFVIDFTILASAVAESEATSGPPNIPGGDIAGINIVDGTGVYGGTGGNIITSEQKTASNDEIISIRAPFPDPTTPPNTNIQGGFLFDAGPTAEKVIIPGNILEGQENIITTSSFDPTISSDGDFTDPTTPTGPTPGGGGGSGGGTGASICPVSCGNLAEENINAFFANPYCVNACPHVQPVEEPAPQPIQYPGLVPREEPEPKTTITSPQKNAILEDIINNIGDDSLKRLMEPGVQDNVIQEYENYRNKIEETGEEVNIPPLFRYYDPENIINTLRETKERVKKAADGLRVQRRTFTPVAERKLCKKAYTPEELKEMPAGLREKARKMINCACTGHGVVMSGISGSQQGDETIPQACKRTCIERGEELAEERGEDVPVYTGAACEAGRGMPSGAFAYQPTGYAVAPITGAQGYDPDRATEGYQPEEQEPTEISNGAAEGYDPERARPDDELNPPIDPETETIEGGGREPSIEINPAPEPEDTGFINIGPLGPSYVEPSGDNIIFGFGDETDDGGEVNIIITDRTTGQEIINTQYINPDVTADINNFIDVTDQRPPIPPITYSQAAEDFTNAYDNIFVQYVENIGIDSFGNVIDGFRISELSGEEIITAIFPDLTDAAGEQLWIEAGGDIYLITERDSSADTITINALQGAIGGAIDQATDFINYDGDAFDDIINNLQDYDFVFNRDGTVIAIAEDGELHGATDENLDDIVFENYIEGDDFIGDDDDPGSWHDAVPGGYGWIDDDEPPRGPTGIIIGGDEPEPVPMFPTGGPTYPPIEGKPRFPYGEPVPLGDVEEDVPTKTRRDPATGEIVEVKPKRTKTPATGEEEEVITYPSGATSKREVKKVGKKVVKDKITKRDADGNIIEEKEFDHATGKRKVTKYDDEGNVISEEEFDSYGNRIYTVTNGNKQYTDNAPNIWQAIANLDDPYYTKITLDQVGGATNALGNLAPYIVPATYAIAGGYCDDCVIPTEQQLINVPDDLIPGALYDTTTGEIVFIITTIEHYRLWTSDDFNNILYPEEWEIINFDERGAIDVADYDLLGFSEGAMNIIINNPQTRLFKDENIYYGFTYASAVPSMFIIYPEGEEGDINKPLLQEFTTYGWAFTAPYPFTINADKYPINIIDDINPAARFPTTTELANTNIPAPYYDYLWSFDQDVVNIPGYFVTYGYTGTTLLYPYYTTYLLWPYITTGDRLIGPIPHLSVNNNLLFPYYTGEETGLRFHIAGSNEMSNAIVQLQQQGATSFGALGKTTTPGIVATINDNPAGAFVPDVEWYVYPEGTDIETTNWDVKQITVNGKQQTVYVPTTHLDQPIQLTRTPGGYVDADGNTWRFAAGPGMWGYALEEQNIADLWEGIQLLDNEEIHDFINTNSEMEDIIGHTVTFEDGWYGVATGARQEEGYTGKAGHRITVDVYGPDGEKKGTIEVTWNEWTTRRYLIGEMRRELGLPVPLDQEDAKEWYAREKRENGDTWAEDITDALIDSIEPANTGYEHWLPDGTHVTPYDDGTGAKFKLTSPDGSTETLTPDQYEQYLTDNDRTKNKPVGKDTEETTFDWTARWGQDESVDESVEWTWGLSPEEFARWFKLKELAGSSGDWQEQYTRPTVAEQENDLKDEMDNVIEGVELKYVPSATRYCKKVYTETELEDLPPNQQEILSKRVSCRCSGPSGTVSGITGQMENGETVVQACDRICIARGKELQSQQGTNLPVYTGERCI